MTSTFRALSTSKLFLFGLFVKFLCLFTIVGPDAHEHFLPFLDHAVQNLGENPWSNMSSQAFPYGGTLLVLLLVPKAILYALCGGWALGTNAPSVFALKAPLLLADFACLVTLTQFLPERRSSILNFYWLNPALFFITYIYGQLDIVSTAFVAGAILLILTERPLLSALTMGLALGCKFHVAICIPLVLAYIWNREFSQTALRQIFAWLSVFTLTGLVVMIPPVLANRGASVTLGSPEVARLFALQIPLVGGIVLYAGIIAVGLILGRLLISTRISKFGLIWGATLLMSGLVLASHAATGWYAWCLPFLALFYAVYLNVPRSIYWGVQILYLAVHATRELIPAAQSWPPEVWSLLHTLLEAAMFTNVYFVWSVGTKRELPMRKRTGALRIGLAGDSGSGKNHLTVVLSDLFNPRGVVVFEGDDYHRWERGHTEWSRYTHLNPMGNSLIDLAQDVSTIASGRAVMKAAYDHGTGRFNSKVERKPARVVIAQGLHTFFLRSARRDFDLKIYLNPDPELRRAWKIQRDVVERGYDEQKVLKSMESRIEDANKFVQPQRESADLVLEMMGPKGESARWLAWNDVDLSRISDALAAHGLESKICFETERPDRVAMTVSGNLKAELTREIAFGLFSPIRHLTRARGEPRWHSGFDGINQLVVLAFLSRHAEEISL